MDIELLKTFLKIVEYSSFSNAAAELNLTQPAVSKRVHSIEKQLGSKVFDRIGHQILLTDAGEVLKVHAVKMINAFENCQHAISNLQQEVRGTLELATSHHVALHHLPSPLRNFNQTFPQVKINFHFLNSEEAYQAVLSTKVELAIITLSPKHSSQIKAHKLWEDPLIPTISPSHPLHKANTPVSLEELSQYVAILPEKSTYTREMIEEKFIEKSLRIQRVTDVNYLETIKKLVETGLGWSVLPTKMVDSSLIPIYNKELNMSRQLGLITHRSKTLSRAAVEFINILQKIR
ncbi:MAG: LysR family transcriptional regulator [Pseudomonadota bacterium]